ncbi:MAG: PAS domain-containing protein, partial [Deltaproteobacteria bacterium]|nr:PAS domain-containing protein [Deltaproteobacteria bacterium]
MCALTSLEVVNSQDPSPPLKFLSLTHSEILDDYFPEGVFLINTRWQLLYFNHMAEEITGFTRQEAIGKFCWDIFRADQCH